MNKPGIKSTEVWLALIGMVGGLVLSALPDSPWTQIMGGVLATVCGASYSLGRSYAKGKTDAAGHTARAVVDAMLKKK